MNVDELLRACFDVDPASLVGGNVTFLERLEDTDDVISYLEVAWRTVLVWLDTNRPGSGVVERTATIRVAAILNLCVDPSRRNEGFASKLIQRAHEETLQHGLIDFSVLMAKEGTEGFYERVGYRPVDERIPRFLVCPLRDSVWPAGRIDLVGRDW